MVMMNGPRTQKKQVVSSPHGDLSRIQTLNNRSQEYSIGTSTFHRFLKCEFSCLLSIHKYYMYIYIYIHIQYSLM